MSLEENMILTCGSTAMNGDEAVVDVWLYACLIKQALHERIAYSHVFGALVPHGETGEDRLQRFCGIPATTEF